MQIKLAQDLVEYLSLHPEFYQALKRFTTNEHLVFQIHPEIWRKVILGCVSPDQISLFPILSSQSYLLKFVFPGVLEEAFNQDLTKLSHQDLVKYFFEEPHLSGLLKIKTILRNLLLDSSQTHVDLLTALLKGRRVIERIHHLDLRTLIVLSKHEVYSIPEEIGPTLKELHRNSRMETQRWRKGWRRVTERLGGGCKGTFCFRAPKVMIH